MKTNHTARQIVRLRPFLSFLAVVAILGADLGLGGSMAWRMEQASSTRTPPGREHERERWGLGRLGQVSGSAPRCNMVFSFKPP